MINIAKVKCPHCGIEGQVVSPDAATLIVGPCPECSQLVVIFGGVALPLDTQLMEHASKEASRDHIYAVLDEYVKERINALFSMASDTAESPESEAASPPPDFATSAISDIEINYFASKELPLLDDAHYFKAIFG